jgi:type I restriction enzyme S subunit
MTWRTKQLRDLADLCLGKMLDKEKNKGVLRPYLANLNVRWGTFDLSDLREMRFEDREIERYGVRGGDIVMCEGGEPGRCAIWRDQRPGMMLQKALHRIRSKSEIDHRFLFYSLLHKGQTHALDQYFTGATIKHLPGEKLALVEVEYPTLGEQRRIASILSAYNDLIENNTRRISILEEMARRIYEEWFVRFRFPGHEGVRMVESELGVVPEGWPVTELGALLSVDKGLSYKGAGLTGMGVPMVNLKNVLPGGGFRRDGTKPYSGEYKPRHVVRAGDIVLANTDLTQAGTVVGSPAIVPDMGVGECIFSHHIYAVRLQAAMAQYRAFVYGLLAHDSFKSFAKGHAVGTTVLGMPKEGVTNFRFARPPEDLMRGFSSLASPIHDLAETLHAKNANLRATRDLLLPKLISGELDVSAIPEPEALAA